MILVVIRSKNIFNKTKVIFCISGNNPKFIIRLRMALLWRLISPDTFAPSHIFHRPPWLSTWQPLWLFFWNYTEKTNLIFLNDPTLIFGELWFRHCKLLFMCKGFAWMPIRLLYFTRLIDHLKRDMIFFIVPVHPFKISPPTIKAKPLLIKIKSYYYEKVN